MNHIALIIPTLDRIGGAERQVILLAKGLIKRGWRVSVIALSGNGGSSADELSDSGIAFLSLEMRKGLVDPRGWIRFNRWLRREKPNVVHAHLPHAVWFARWSRLGAPVRIVVDTLHSTSTGSCGRKIGYRISNWLTDKITAVSSAVADAYVSRGIVPENRLVVLPNGVDTELPRPDPSVRATLRRELGITDEFLWLAAGRLETVKDYPTLLRAMAQITGPARLAIAGAGPLDHALHQFADDVGVRQRVNFLGFQPDVRRWMQAADGFVLSSLWEGLPMGLLEAAACALPAVATDVAGSWETIVHGQTGLLAAAGDAQALAEAMTRLMRTPPEVRRAMGECAQQFVAERCGLNRVLDRWESLYRQLLERNLTAPGLGHPRQA